MIKFMYVLMSTHGKKNSFVEKQCQIYWRHKKSLKRDILPDKKLKTPILLTRFPARPLHPGENFNLCPSIPGNWDTRRANLQRTSLCNGLSLPGRVWLCDFLLGLACRGCDLVLSWSEYSPPPEKRLHGLGCQVWSDLNQHAAAQLLPLAVI